MLAFDFGVGGVHVGEHLRANGLAGLAAAVDVDLGALLLALVAVEDAQAECSCCRRRWTIDGMGLLVEEF